MKNPYLYLWCLLLTLWWAPSPSWAQDFDPNQPMLIANVSGGPNVAGIPASPNFDNMVQPGAHVELLPIAGNGINGLAHQQWYVRLVPGYTDRYHFVNRNSGQVLRMNNVVHNDGTVAMWQQIEQWPLLASDLSAQWYITPVPPNDTYYPSSIITSVLNNKTLYNQGGTVLAKFTPLQTSGLIRWYFAGAPTPRGPSFDGVFTLSNVNANPNYASSGTRTVMQVVSKSLYPGARIEQGYDVGIASQQWQLVGSMPGPFAIYNRASGLVLQLYLASTADGAKLEQGGYSASEATQRWYVEDVTTPGAPATMYKITNGWLGGRCIQVEGQGQYPGARLEIGNYIGINSQKWYLGYFSAQRGTSSTAAAGAAVDIQPLAVYPNPATDQVTAICPGASPGATLSVTSVEGKQLLRQPYTGTVDVKRLPAGLYVLTIQDGAQTFRQKFTKQ